MVCLYSTHENYGAAAITTDEEEEEADTVDYIDEVVADDTPAQTTITPLPAYNTCKWISSEGGSMDPKI